MTKVRKNLTDVRSNGKVSSKKQLDIFDIAESIIPDDKRLYIPDWTNRPPPAITVITTQDKRILTTGNLMTIVSRPGTGKSSVCEALMAGLLNKSFDSLGFGVELPAGRNKILYIDTERTIHDTWTGWKRTYERAGIKKPDLSPQLIFVNFRSVGIKDRIKYATELLTKNSEIGLVIFDGAGDFVQDTNSINESTEFIDWINSFNHRISVVATLHTNPLDTKPRGHLGSELCRRAESVLLLRKENDGMREITTSFEHGKVRNDDDQISYYYEWSDDFQMFVLADYEPPAAIKQEQEQQHQAIIDTIFNGHAECSAKHIIERMAEITGKTGSASKGLFYRHFTGKLVVSSGNGFKRVTK